jgi:glycosyltransferase involved in cell wall biosynthesis
LKVIICIPDLGCGGAERVVSKLANSWASTFQISLITLTPTSCDFYKFDKAIERICISRKKTRWYEVFSQLNTVKELRFYFKQIQPDYIVSFLPKMNILSLIASTGTDYKVIACERNVINDPDIDFRQRLLRGLLYKRAYKITVQHDEIFNEFLKEYPSIQRNKVFITPNPVNQFHSDHKSDPAILFESFTNTDKLVMAVGRFTPTKAFKDLIGVFSSVNTLNPSIKLVIFGEGPEFNECRELVLKLGLKETIAMPGPTADITSWYARADLFVTTTKHEGFPNAVSEALSAGLPVVAFQAPSISFLVKDNLNGYVVENRDKGEMARKIVNLIADHDISGNFSREAKKISDEYSFDKVSKIWLDEVLV